MRLINKNFDVLKALVVTYFRLYDGYGVDEGRGVTNGVERQFHGNARASRDWLFLLLVREKNVVLEGLCAKHVFCRASAQIEVEE